jgi:hypothetical protein
MHADEQYQQILMWKIHLPADCVRYIREPVFFFLFFLVCEWHVLEPQNQCRTVYSIYMWMPSAKRFIVLKR